MKYPNTGNLATDYHIVCEWLKEKEAEIDRLKEDLANAKDEGFSSATLPTKEAEEKLLKRISDLVWLVRNLSDALDCVYGKLPSHWRELPFSYHELKRKVKEVMKNG